MLSLKHTQCSGTTQCWCAVPVHMFLHKAPVSHGIDTTRGHQRLTARLLALVRMSSGLQTNGRKSPFCVDITVLRTTFTCRRCQTGNVQDARSRPTIAVTQMPHVFLQLPSHRCSAIIGTSRKGKGLFLQSDPSKKCGEQPN